MSAIADSLETLLSIATEHSEEADSYGLDLLNELTPSFEMLLPMLYGWARGQGDLDSAPYFDGFVLLLQQGMQEFRMALRGQSSLAQIHWEGLQEELELLIADHDHSTLCHCLLDTLAHFDFPMPELLIEKAGRWLQQHHERIADETLPLPSTASVSAIFSPLLMEAKVDSPFAFYELFKGQITYLPQDGLQYLLRTMLITEQMTIREGILLCLLHPRKAVLEALLAVLQQSQVLQGLSKQSLNRLIMLRNWLPESHTRSLDSVIRKLRRVKLADSATTEQQAKVCKLLVSAPDGAGATAVFVLFKFAKDYQITGCILKEKVGIVDCWVSTNMTKAAAEQTFSTLGEHLPPLFAVKREFLEVLVPHFLTLNKLSGEPLDPILLQWLEQLGGSLWQPNNFDCLNWLNEQQEKLACVDPEKSIKRIERWYNKHQNHLMWFENDDDTIERACLIIEDEMEEKVEQGFEPLYDSLLNPHREKWRDRFVRMALWAQHEQQNRAPHWEDFALIAAQLAHGASMAKNPAGHSKVSL